MSTGKLICKERWLFTKNLRSVLKMEKEKVIKQALDIFQMNIEKKFNELQKIDPEVSLSLLKNEFQGKVKLKAKSISIIEVMQKHAAFFERKVTAGERAPASLQKYGRAKDLVVAVIRKQYGIVDIEAIKINSAYPATASIRSLKFFIVIVFKIKIASKIILLLTWVYQALTKR